MRLVVDVGNTHTVFGLFDGARLAHLWRVSTLVRTGDEVGPLLLQLFALAGMAVAAVTGVAVCSVVPAVVPGIERGVRRYLDLPTNVLDHRSDLGFPVRVDTPGDVGPDRLVNAVAVRERVAPPFLIVDFGTATTFDCVDASGAFVGGAIAPGLQIAADALFSRTARLPRVALEAPPTAIGANTADAIRSGLFWGYVGLVDGLVRRCKDSLGGTPRCIATGGLSGVIGGACVEIDEVDEHLTLQGLRLWLERGAK